MPNLRQIAALKEKYGSKNNVLRSDIKLLSESFKRTSLEIKNLFASSGANNNVVSYFEGQQSANVVLLFVDITGFSTKCKSFTNSQLSLYLDDYYDKVISAIYRHGGEIEKIIGDGIICIFGEPFLSEAKSKLFEKADACAKDIVIELKDTNKEVKIALHDGVIMYYKNKTEDYPEYTMIGKPLTEIFRLEGVSENNSINYYHVSSYDSMSASKEGVYKYSQSNIHSYWKKSALIQVELKGVEWSFIKSFSCTYKT